MNNIVFNTLFTTDECFLSFRNALNKCVQFKDTFFNAYDQIKLELSDKPVSKNYFAQDFHENLPKELPKQRTAPKLSFNIMDMEKFLAKHLNFSITAEEKIKEYFVTPLDNNNDIYLTTFKDNASNACSDKVILINLSMILAVNSITDVPLPFPILNTELNKAVPKFEKRNEISDTANNTQYLFAIYDFLNNIEIVKARSLFSQESISFFYADRCVSESAKYIRIINRLERYYEDERKYLLKDTSDFLPLFLSCIGLPEGYTDSHKKYMKDYYKRKISELKNLYEEIKKTSNILWKKYLRELPHVIEEQRIKDELQEQFDMHNCINETVSYVLECFTDKKEPDIQLKRFMTFLTKFSAGNDLSDIIELVYNICPTEEDNISDLAKNIFFLKYQKECFEYYSETTDNLYEVLNISLCSLSNAEKLADLFCQLEFDNDGWTFLCSLLLSQINAPCWYQDFKEIIKIIRKNDYFTLE